MGCWRQCVKHNLLLTSYSQWRKTGVIETVYSTAQTFVGCHHNPVLLLSYHIKGILQCRRGSLLFPALFSHQHFAEAEQNCFSRITLASYWSIIKCYPFYQLCARNSKVSSANQLIASICLNWLLSSDHFLHFFKIRVRCFISRKEDF